MPRDDVIPVSIMAGSKGEAHLNASLLTSTNNSQEFSMAADDLVVYIHNGGGNVFVIMEAEKNGRMNRSEDGANIAFAAGEIMVFGPLGLDGWVQQPDGLVGFSTVLTGGGGEVDAAVLRGL